MKICVTGLCGCGKTTLCKYLSNNNYSTLIVDDYINWLYLKNNNGWKIANKYFKNQDIFDLANNVSKQKLLTLFINKEKNVDLFVNEINKLIFEKIRSLNNQKKWIIELGSYISYEDFFKPLFDYVILIKANKYKIKKNLQKRNFVYNKNHPGINQKKLINYNFKIKNNFSLINFYKKINKIIKEVENE